MTSSELAHIIPYLASFLISIFISGYAWTKRQAQGALGFELYMVGQTVWIAGFILEMISKELGDKIFWDQVQWFCSTLIFVAIPIFAIQFTEHRIYFPRRYFFLSLIVPMGFSFLLATNSIHHLIYNNPSLVASTPFSELHYDFTFVIYLYGLYGGAIALWSGQLVFKRLIQPQSLYRAQALIVLLGFAIPLISWTLTLLGVQITPERDSTPFSAAIGNLIIAWGIFRFHIFEVIPIARDRVFEALADPVVILDKNNIVIDINAAMLTLMDKREHEVIGNPAKDVFNDFPIPIKLYTHVSYARTEAVFEISGKQIHYDLTIWPLYNTNKEMVGRVYVSHDITALKELEAELRKLNVQLEDRVRDRTRELAEAYESMLEGLALALELRDKETEGHSRRVTENAIKLAQKMGIAGSALEDIRSGAILHDIGKISIPDEILHKPGKLTLDERAVVEKHPETAFKLLSRIPFLSQAIEIPYCHHEKWDGTGYPRKLAGEDIPLSARIFAVADVWDALSYDRPYNKAWTREQIIEYFNEQTGKHFDPAITKIFLSMVEKGEI
ncbi:MAG TPA: histidine kinase N-terminal 7TM domain-containing protein [Anaerolineales bacterium]|nr:histidine kinase N-terminal 7TM domain-containing protein [Anaerolineales bacterium]